MLGRLTDSGQKPRTPKKRVSKVTELENAAVSGGCQAWREGRKEPGEIVFSATVQSKGWKKL